MKRILHIFNALNHSGAEVMFAGAVRHFERFGFKTYVLATDREVGGYAEVMKESGAIVIHKELRYALSHLIYIYKLIKKERINIIHIHPEKRHYYLWLSLIAKLLNVRCIRSIHSNFRSEDFLRKKAKCFVRRAAIFLGCEFVSVSESVAHNEYEQCGIKTKVILNWVDTAKFQFSSDLEKSKAKLILGIDKNTTVLLSVGNCSSVKNHKFLIECIPEIIKVFPDFIYLHAGKEDEDSSEQFLAQELGVEAYVRFLGPRNDVSNLLASADIYVMPSLYEGLSISALEALASGVPSVFADVPGLDTFKKYNPLASYFKLHDAEGLLLQLKKAMSIPSKTKNEVAQLVKSNYSIERGVESYIRVYER